uniref:KilA-N domain-containing protein n=1 Tax=viral metagenome TaxID=1070528 RepID=A0A6C0KF50_9ZZZZ
MICQYCNKEFSSKISLYQHQQKAKYCLQLQGLTNTNYNCEHCNKSLSTNERLLTHFNSCKIKKKKDEVSKENDLTYGYKNSIKDLQNEILNYQEKIREKTDYIAKLETKLEKFENAVVANMAATTHALYEEENDDNEEAIPLVKKLDSIVINDDDRKNVEYSNITLNNVVITSRPIDHYVNATQLCQAGGKKFNDWFRLDTTKELINELEAEAGIPASGLIDTKTGGNDKSKQGSWIHPDLSIQLAQWISPKFAIQVSKWIRTIFRDGSLEIDLSLMREKEVEMREKDARIKQLESVCLSKQRRAVYPERNVIYMLTTDDHLKRRTYIIGKAKNLTNRLSTYNKTCDHTVVHYRECKNEDDMDTVEILILNKLRDYREQANRDRFILPDDKDDSFFTRTIDECIGFL